MRSQRGRSILFLAMLLTSGLSFLAMMVFVALIQPEGPLPELDVAEDQESTVVHE